MWWNKITPINKYDVDDIAHHYSKLTFDVS